MSEQVPRPIPRVYQGVVTRSTLEARWLIWLDALQVPWCYEFEGWRLGVDGRPRGYLPDVWLPREKVWLEIKPPGSAVEEDGLYHAFADAVRRDLLLVQGSPWHDEHTVRVFQPDQAEAPAGFVFALGRTDKTLWLWRVKPALAYPLSPNVDGDHLPLARCDALDQAYRHARQYRFWVPGRER